MITDIVPAWLNQGLDRPASARCRPRPGGVARSHAFHDTKHHRGAIMKKSCRVGVDIGGTFTDIALDLDGSLFSTKLLTNYAAPERAIVDGVQTVAARAGVPLGDIDVIIHGTTLFRSDRK